MVESVLTAVNCNVSAQAKLKSAINFMLDHFGEELTLDDIASAVGTTRFNLCRSFQRCFGISPVRWLWQFRTNLAAEFISQAPGWALTDIAFTCGFTSSAHFSRSFRKVMGVSPSDFRKGARTEDEAESLCGRRTTMEDFDRLYEDNGASLQKAAILAFGQQPLVAH